jgi:hypothetical protein
MPPNVTPEQMEKMQQFVDILAEGIFKNWESKGVFKYLLDQFASQIPTGGLNGVPHNFAPRQEKIVTVKRKRGNRIVEEPTTGAQLLAEIADKQGELIEAIDELIFEVAEKKRRR